MKNFAETLYDSYCQSFSIDKVYFQQKTDHQDLLIFQNSLFGRVMALDGIIQTTEKDEFYYHEMLAHVPILAQGHAKRVLVIGGGDGGMLREVLKHQSVEKAVLVEIDQQVIAMCKTYLPSHSQGAFDDPRVEIVINDGKQYVLETQQQFDVIISDSTDPIGPGESLFTSEYYQACQRCLTENGILVTQNGVPYFQTDEAIDTARRFANIFNDYHFYSAAVPTYIGGIMLFGFASNNKDIRRVSLATIKERFAQANIKTRYYNPDIHIASFALPQYLLEAIGKKENNE